MVKRITVMKLFREIDPEGVEGRKKEETSPEEYTMQKRPTLSGTSIAMTNWNLMDSVCMEPSMDFQGG